MAHSTELVQTAVRQPKNTIKKLHLSIQMLDFYLYLNISVIFFLLVLKISFFDLF